MQREALLDHVLIQLEQHGLAATLPELLQGFDITESELQPFWPDKDALIFDCLRHHGQQIDIWQRQVMLDDTLTTEQKLLARYDQLAMRLEKIVSQAVCLSRLVVLILMSIHKSIS